MSLHLLAEGITKQYQNGPVLLDCSCSLGGGGIHLLTGPNGCGKSTFLRICALLEMPDRGSISYFDGQERVPGNMALMRRLTLVLPRLGLFNTSVFQNISYGLRVRGLSKKEIADRVDEILAFVGLVHKRDQAALTLSSGEAQRTAIARALVIDPEMLYLDEPTASVDEKNVTVIEDIIMKLKQQGKTTIVMTTHDRPQAERLADRLFVIEEGRIVE